MMTDAAGLPREFLENMRELLGEEFEAYRESFGEEWKPGLRVNTWKVQPEKLRELVPWELEKVPWAENGFYYKSPAAGQEDRPSRNPCYYAGLYYLQEPSAMTPAAMLPVEPGDMVLDLCAAPGGKSTELAARLWGRGMLVSNDISYSRARALLKNLELMGAPNICVTSESPERLAGVWPEFFDKILVDAPCSGEGMFRRDEGMVKDWESHGPAYYAPIQRQILGQAAAMLKPGGMMLYSTCTFSRVEDEENVEFLLEKWPELELIPLDKTFVPGAVDGIGLSGCLRLFPHRVKGEGHFLALLKKRGTMKDDAVVKLAGSGEAEARSSSFSEASGEAEASGSTARKARQRRGGAAGSAGLCGDFGKLPELAVFLEICDCGWDYSRIVVHQDNAYYLPEGLDRKLPLRFLRTGLLLGELKRGRFEPSQALAMALKEGQYDNTLRLHRDDDRVLRYLKGETISLKDGEGTKTGWCLVTYEGFSLGWAKGNGSSLKNKYYAGWRWQ